MTTIIIPGDTLRITDENGREIAILHFTELASGMMELALKSAESLDFAIENENQDSPTETY
jgi:hypothetical protein